MVSRWLPLFLAPPALAALDTTDWLVLASVALALALYACGARGIGRSDAGRRYLRWRRVAFVSGLALILVALVSPIDHLSQDLLYVHMVQHLLLMMAAAPLLALGAPLVVIGRSLPAFARRALGRQSASGPVRRAAEVLQTPAVAWALAFVVMWAWHAPALYQLALHEAPVHAAEHLSFLATSLLFWHVLFSGRRLRRLDYAPALFYVFLAGLQGTVLGALMALAPHPWYPDYGLAEASHGISPLADQQVAGMVMWLPGGFFYLGSAIVLFVSWMLRLERESEPGALARDAGLAESEPAWRSG